MARIPKNPRFHCYFGCDEGGPLHHFPKPDRDLERFDVWKGVLDIETKAKGNEYIYNQLRLCDKHFENCYKSPSRLLTRNAVPTLYVKDGTYYASQQVEMTPSLSTELSSLSASGTTSSVSKVVSVPVALKNPLKRKLNTGPTKQNLIEAVGRLTNRVLKLTQKCKTQTKKIQALKKISQTKSFMKTIEAMPDSLKTFMKMQLKSKIKAKGRKFTLEEKILCASIWKQSQKGYNFLKKLVVLPSKRTLQRLLSAFSIKPGINQKIIKNLAETVKKHPLEKRLYTLLFDEIALMPGLYYNKNEVIGFENYGDKKTESIADHALVVMIKGIKTKAKQPILFHFCKSTTKTYDLKKLIIDIIRQLRSAGIIILATICDQATTNVSTIKTLQKETREKYLRQNKEYKSNAFEVDDLKVYPIFDTPHLLKGVRNNFMKKNIKFKQDGKIKIAKWEHLRMLLNEDRGEDEIRILNKLTEYHVDPAKIPKMKVKYAAQIFSQRVSFKCLLKL